MDKVHGPGQDKGSMFCPYPVSSEWHTHLDSSGERSKNFKYWTGCLPDSIEDLITVRSRPREVAVMLRSMPCWLCPDRLDVLFLVCIDRCCEFKESLFFLDLCPPANELQTVNLMELNIMKFPFVLTFTITIFTWQDEMFVFWCYLTEKHYDPNLHPKVTLLCLMKSDISNSSRTSSLSWSWISFL